ncbi:THAP domain-containing protein 5-like [Dendronephthya gigantea]|uniref:THAP domain-containing protein 5-like n=1 Tax=Dendronephthya gigantea TaxID=151771 RepID=UPI00106979EE|nr:THAP domain-containing protein 5-like [Dendronephthya gigantea]
MNRDAAVKFIPTKGSLLCSEHFRADMLQMTGQKMMLLPDAVPTIFQKSQVKQNEELVEVALKDILGNNNLEQGCSTGTSLQRVTSGLVDKDCVSMREEAEPMVSNCSGSVTDNVVIQGITEDENSSSLSVQGVNEQVTIGRKRKLSDKDVVINGVSTPKRIHMSHVNHDHTYHISKSPRRMKKHVDNLVNNLTNLQNKFKASKQKTRRLKRKVSTLESVVSELRQSNLINSDCAAILETTFSGVPKELMKRLMSQKKNKNPGAYPPELRSFALTLKFYSTKAYNYVRKVFSSGCHTYL